MARAETATKKTKLAIDGTDLVFLYSPKGSTGLRYRDGRLFACAGGKELRLKSEVMEEVREAFDTYRPPRYENEARARSLATRYGTAERAWEAEDEAAYFEMEQEPRVIDPGTGTIYVWIGREDLVG